MQRERDQYKQEVNEIRMLLKTAEDNLKEVKHTKIVMEEEYKITIEKYVKEVRETHIKLTKVCSTLESGY